MSRQKGVADAELVRLPPEKPTKNSESGLHAAKSVFQLLRNGHNLGLLGGRGMTQARGSRRQRRRKGRDEKGRFQAGFSGNPNGRPPKQPEVPKLLGEQLADRLWEKAPRLGADGKTRMVSAYDLIIERFIASIPDAKPKEIMSMLEWMQKLSVFDNMRAKATNPSVSSFDAEHQRWLGSNKMLQQFNKMF
jgi:hypothetical protein